MVRSILENKKGYLVVPKHLLFAMSFVATLLTLLSLSGIISLPSVNKAVASITGSGEFIDRPIFYYDKCEATGSLSYSQQYSIAKGGSWVIKPTATDQYNVIVSKASDGNIYKEELHYSICNSQILSSSNCRIYDTKITDFNSYSINNIRPTENVFVKIRTGILASADFGSGQYQVSFIPYGIRQYNVLGGSANQINPNSCTYNALPSDTILGTDADRVAQFKPSKNTNERTLQPNEVRWYVAGYLTSRAETFVLNYNGKEAFCRPTGANAEIYQINKLQTSGGTYKIASTDWSDRLGTETCCPSQKQGDATCSDDFKWVKTEGTQCSYTNACGGAEWTPYSDGVLIRYVCESGTCVPETKSVECSSDYDCKDSNEVCDLNKYICVNANVNLQGQVIESIPDNKADCEAKGYTWITKTTEDKSIWNYLGIGEPKVVVTEYCDVPKKINWVIWVLIGVLVIMIFLFRNQIIAGFRWGFGKIGVHI